jgi:hypothetical protein
VVVPALKVTPFNVVIPVPVVTPDNEYESVGMPQLSVAVASQPVPV